MRHDLSRHLARALLASEWTSGALAARAGEALGLSAPWLERLAAKVVAAFPEPPRHDPDLLATFLDGEAELVRAVERRAVHGKLTRVRRVFPFVAGMLAPRRFDVPELGSDAALAEWLGLSIRDLDWFADNKGWLVRAPLGRIHHYRYRWLPKKNGSLRLIEAPKEMLKDVQRRILDELLARVPPHEAAHGFREGRSVVSFVAPHCKKSLVLRMDLREFFPSVSAARVAAIFRAIGYPRPVAFLLTGLVTTRTPEDVLETAGLSLLAEDALRRRHLPQGAPTSPAISNLCAFGLDVRLTAAAESVGASYTRYADDLAFSGGEGFRGSAQRFRLLVCRIAAEEGFTVHWEKNRWMRSAARQRLAGLVVNERPKPSRRDYDRLKAILENCRRNGPAAQNRGGVADFRAHLSGRVSWFEQTDAARGARLRAAFGRIVW